MKKNSPHEKAGPISLPISALQILVACAIMLIFGTYMWLVQLRYDATHTGYERAFYYALIVAGAGFSYDCAKKIVFLPQKDFIEFGKHLGAMIGHFVFVLVCAFAAGFLINNGTTFSMFAGQVVYLIAAGWLWFAVSNATRALEIASK